MSPATATSSLARRPDGALVQSRKPKSLVLSVDERRRDDDSDDSIFFSTPRLTMHFDIGYATKLQALYQERMPKGCRVLDLGASCATLLPDDLAPSEVICEARHCFLSTSP